MAWLVVWLVALSFWHFGGHWSSFAHFTRYLGCDGFIRAFGGSAAWSVVSSVLRVAGSGWWLVPFVFPPSWFGVVVVSAAPSGLRPPCCGLLRGQFSAPQRSCAVYLGAVHG